MEVDGQTFKPGAAIVHNIGSLDKDPEIATISNIYIVNSNVIVFKVNLFKVIHYEHHLRSFVITPCHSNSFISHAQLPLYLPLHPRKCRVLPGQTIIIMPFYLI